MLGSLNSFHFKYFFGVIQWKRNSAHIVATTKILTFNTEHLIEKVFQHTSYVEGAVLLVRRYISGTDLKHIGHGMHGINE